MESRVRVECPHCGKDGQLVLPSMLSIIIGACPKCKESVLVFCGRVLPLDTAVMEAGSPEEQHEHVLGVITKSLSEWMHALIQGNSEYRQRCEADNGPEEGDEPALEDANSEETAHAGFGPITDDEVYRFVRIDLELLDKEEYFRSVFDQS